MVTSKSCLILLIHFGWVTTLPPSDFIHAFMKTHRLNSLTYHSGKVGNKLEVKNLHQDLRDFKISVISTEVILNRFHSWPKLQACQTDLKMISKDLLFSPFLAEKFKDCKDVNCGYWLIDVADKVMDRVMDTLSQLDIDIDDQIYLYAENDDQIELFEAYKIGSDDEAKIIEYGSWTRDQGLRVSMLDIWQRRSNMAGFQFRIATLESMPYVTKMEINPETGLYEMEGMFPDVFFSLQSVMNFTFSLAPPPDKEWGSVDLNGSWTGMVGMLQRKELDIAVTDFTVTKERSAVMTFAEPITQIYHSLFVKNPQGIPNYTAYIEPFKSDVWIVIVGLISVVSPILFCVIRNGQFIDEQQNEFTLAKSFVFATSMLTFMRPWSVTPSSFRGKLAYGSILIGGTLIYFHWEAMLISYLATRKTVLPFKSLQDLVDNTAFKISLPPGSSFMDAFKHSTDPVWQKAWQDRIEPYLNSFSKIDGHDLKVMEETDYAMYENYFAVETFPTYISCEIVAIPEKYDFKPYAYGFQKNSPFLGPFNYYLKQLREKGSIKKILEKYEARPQLCPDYSGQALGFDSCFTAFICLCSGAGLALLLFLVEKMSKVLASKQGQVIPGIDSYGKIDLNIERQIVLNSNQVDDRTKGIIAKQAEYIQHLELGLQRRRRTRQSFLADVYSSYGF